MGAGGRAEKDWRAEKGGGRKRAYLVFVLLCALPFFKRLKNKKGKKELKKYIYKDVFLPRREPQKKQNRLIDKSIETESFEYILICYAQRMIEVPNVKCQFNERLIWFRKKKRKNLPNGSKAKLYYLKYLTTLFWGRKRKARFFLFSFFLSGFRFFLGVSRVPPLPPPPFGVPLLEQIWTESERRNWKRKRNWYRKQIN